MTTSNIELMAQARGRLANKWGTMGLTTLIYLLLQSGISMLIFLLIGTGQLVLCVLVALVLGIAIAKPLKLGLMSLSLVVSRGDEADISGLFQWFASGNVYRRALILNVLTELYIQLWMLPLGIPSSILLDRFLPSSILTNISALPLLLVWMFVASIPALIAVYSYALAPYILNDNPNITPNEAITRSKKLMYGHRWRLACLQGWFIGWWLLCILTLGIGSLWLIPYYQVSLSRFYDDLLANEMEPQILV